MLEMYESAFGPAVFRYEGEGVIETAAGKIRGTMTCIRSETGHILAEMVDGTSDEPVLVTRNSLGRTSSFSITIANNRRVESEGHLYLFNLTLEDRDDKTFYSIVWHCTTLKVEVIEAEAEQPDKLTAGQCNFILDAFQSYSILLSITRSIRPAINWMISYQVNPILEQNGVLPGFTQDIRDRIVLVIDQTKAAKVKKGDKFYVYGSKLDNFMQEKAEQYNAYLGVLNWLSVVWDKTDQSVK